MEAIKCPKAMVLFSDQGHHVGFMLLSIEKDSLSGDCTPSAQVGQIAVHC